MYGHAAALTSQNTSAGTTSNPIADTRSAAEAASGSDRPATAVFHPAWSAAAPSARASAVPLNASAAETVRDRQPPVAPEGARGYADAGRRLPPLVFGQVDHADHPLYVLARQPQPGQLVGVEVALDVTLEDLVEHLVGRQRVLVLLVGRQLSRRRPGRDIGRDELA